MGRPLSPPHASDMRMSGLCRALICPSAAAPDLGIPARDPSFFLDANGLKSIDIFAERNFDRRRGTIGSLRRLAGQVVVRPGFTEGYRDMAGSNRSQDIHPQSTCGSPAAGGPRSRCDARTPSRPRQARAAAGANPKFPAASLRVQRSQQRPAMVVTAPLRS